MDTPGDVASGGTVALDTQTALVGTATPSGSTDHPNGVASVFTSSDGRLSRRETLEPTSTATLFGASVAVDGDTALVGDPMAVADDGSFAGAVTLYERSNGNWDAAEALAPADPTGIDRFGTAVALDGDTVMVGATTSTNADGRRTGAVTLFDRSSGQWRRRRNVEPDDPTVSRFGRSVVLDGGNFAVGGSSLGQEGEPFGVVSVGLRNGGTCRQVTELSGRSAQRDPSFGTSLAMDEETLVVGAPTESSDGTTRDGVVYVYTRSRGAWTNQQRLRPIVTGTRRRFGTAVAIAGDTLVVTAAPEQRHPRARGRNGTVHVFTRGGARWSRDSVHAVGPKGDSDPAVAAATDGRTIAVRTRPSSTDTRSSATTRVIHR